MTSREGAEVPGGLDSVCGLRVGGCYTVAVAVLLALISGVVYGVSDYLGGRASRHVRPVSVALWAEVTLFTITLVAVPLIEPNGPTAAAVGWGLAAGVFGSIGVLGLYRVLSTGNMTVAAPVTGLVAAIVPVAVGISIGERPSPTVLIGIVVAIVAVALIGGLVGAVGAAPSLPTVALAVLAGSAFGMLFVAFSRAGEDGGLWPLLTARFSAAPALGLAALAMAPAGERLPRNRQTMLPGISVGVLIGVANGLYLLATHHGLLSVVAVLVALYPASTVMLAAVLDHERATRWQVAGMITAALGVVLMTAGA